MSCLSVCKYAGYVPDTQRGQKGASDPLELESQVFVSYKWELDLGPLQEQAVLLTTESFLRALVLFLKQDRVALSDLKLALQLRQDLNLWSFCLSLLVFNSFVYDDS